MPYVYRPNHPAANENGLVDKSLVAYDHEDPRFYVISDNMDATRHMATGRMHTSKSEFRKDTKASGCVEIGTDTSFLQPRQQIKLDRRKRRDDIRRVFYELRNR